MGYRQSYRRKIDPIEPPCRKTVYYSKEEAQDMIRYINENRVGKEITVYKCDICGFWHLTSKID